MDKLVKYIESEQYYKMYNLTPRRTGLAVDIWSEHCGILNKYQPNVPRIKLGKREQFNIFVSIEEKPKILARTKNISQSDMNNIEEAIEYVGRNYDLFLKHFNDTTDEYDDDDLKEDLRKRGEYK